MLFTEAFRALGYEVEAPRIDWSAEKRGGVCLSLWRKELRPAPAGLVFDSRRDAQPIETWNRKAGFKRRLAHLQRAVAEHGGRVDVVLVGGIPGGSYGDADPWKPELRGAKWYVTEFDPISGHFAAETRATG